MFTKVEYYMAMKITELLLCNNMQEYHLWTLSERHQAKKGAYVQFNL